MYANPKKKNSVWFESYATNNKTWEIILFELPQFTTDNKFMQKKGLQKLISIVFNQIKKKKFFEI